VLLPTKEGVALDDTLDIDHPVSARVGVRRAPAYLFAVNGAVDDDVADMDALRAVFLRAS
jgi:hypothetical protein